MSELKLAMPESLCRLKLLENLDKVAKNWHFLRRFLFLTYLTSLSDTDLASSRFCEAFTGTFHEPTTLCFFDGSFWKDEVKFENIATESKVLFAWEFPLFPSNGFLASFKLFVLNFFQLVDAMVLVGGRVMSKTLISLGSF